MVVYIVKVPNCSPDLLVFADKQEAQRFHDTIYDSATMTIPGVEEHFLQGYKKENSN